MMKFICKNCSYKFEAEKADVCPYCDEHSVEKEKSADELIDEVSDLLEK